MNHSMVNKAILDGKTGSLKKDETLYSYLLLNNVAYYFSSTLVARMEDWDKAVIKAGDKFNARFIKTLVLINKICRKKKILYALYKTYKPISEAVDGDIDLFVKEKDFDLFMSTFENEGFMCRQTEPLKGECVKAGFCKIEPRCDVSFHGIQVLAESEVWLNSHKEIIGGITVPVAAREIDVLGLLLNILYGPNYCKLYFYKVLKKTNKQRLKSLVKSKSIRNDVSFLLSWLAGKKLIGKRFPLFVDNFNFVSWWFRRILMSSRLSTFQKLKHLAFFFYSKYGYVLFNRLPFTHDWGMKYG